MAWGRLALIHAAGVSDDTLDKMATLWGYALEQKTQQSAEETDSQEPASTQTPETTRSQHPSRPAALFVVVSDYQDLRNNAEQPDYLNNPNYTLAPDPDGSYCFTPAQPLLNIASLIPLLHNGLGQTRTGNNIDMARLSTQLAQGQPLKRLPYLPRRVWPQQLQIIVDARLELEPYWPDFAYIVTELKHLLGEAAVTAIRFDDDTVSAEHAYCLPYPACADADWQPWQLPANDVAVLVLSDLQATYWQRLLTRLQQRLAPLLTLSPSAVCALPWATATPLSPHPPRHPYQQGYQFTDLPEEKRLQIFALLAALPLIDAALLRRLRLALNWGGSELEYLIWQHPEVRNNGLGIYFPKDQAETYRAYYPEDTAEFWEIVHDHHARAYQGLRHLEGLHHYALEQHTPLDIKDYYQRLAATLAQTPEHHAQHRALQAQARTVIALMPRCTLATDLNEVIHRLAEFAYADDLRAENWQALLNHGLDLSKLAIRNPTEAHTAKDWHIVQLGQNRIACVQATPPPPLSVATLTAHLPPVYTDADGKQQVICEQPITLPAQPPFTLKTANQQLTLSTLSKPGWAQRMWRDKQGVFVGVDWCGNTYTLPWRGDWEWGNSPFNRDRYGVYADLTIKRVTQRLRWIEAGTFLMGSPKDEHKRYENEQQHQVTLSHGYWLADTACTQALWEAVMGGNPAHFRVDKKYLPVRSDKNPPVEQVSWNHVQEFISKLNGLLPDAYARLPTEAEWEYACRAGTTTAFSFGDTITPEQVNYDGNYPYRGAEKGLDRNKTVAVKSLPPNAWGLYEMHGNVWEWCADGYGEYPNGAVIDPTGATEAAARVLRGSSWRHYALYARSANRNYYMPERRCNYLGFRLALGQPTAS